MTDRHAGRSAKCKLTPLEQAAIRLSEHCITQAPPTTRAAVPSDDTADTDSPLETVLATKSAKSRQKTGGPQ